MFYVRSTDYFILFIYYNNNQTNCSNKQLNIRIGPFNKVEGVTSQT